MRCPGVVLAFAATLFATAALFPGRGEAAPEEAPPGTGEVVGVVRRDGVGSAAQVELRRMDRHPRLGDPFSDARRLVAAWTAAPLAVARTAEDGRFEWTGLDAGRYALRAVAGDGATADDEVVLDANGLRERVVLDLLPSTAPLRGRVVSADGTAWRGHLLAFPVRAASEWDDRDPPAPRVASTDAEGRYEVGGLPEGEVHVLAVDASGDRVASSRARVPSDAEHVVTVEEGTIATSGRVVRVSDRAPIAGAEVMGTTRWGGAHAPAFRATTGSDGRFEVRVPGPVGRLLVRARGFLDSEERVDRARSDVEIRLNAAARIRGRLRTAAGHPVAGATVSLSAEVQIRAGRIRWSLPQAVTDAEGRYELPGLEPTTGVVSARGSGWVSSGFLERSDEDAFRVTVGAGEEATLDLVAVRAARVRGTVLDPDGKPVRGARVAPVARPEDDSEEGAVRLASGREDARVTDADGSFLLDSLVPGVAYRLSATAAGLPRAEPEVVTADAEVEAHVVLRVPPSRWIRVRVTAADTGEPVAGAVVQAFEGEIPLRGIFPSGVPVRTDAAGRARVGPVGLGQPYVSADASGFVTERSPRRTRTAVRGDGETARLRLVRGREIRGRVLTPLGEPVPGADVFLATDTRPGARSGRGTAADREGRFRFEAQPEGELTLRCELALDGEYEATAPVPPGNADVTLTLAPGTGSRRVVARVLDPEGRPVPSADAWLEMRRTGYSDHVEDGRAEFDVDREPAEGAVGSLRVHSAWGHDGVRLPLGPARVDGVRTGRVVEVRLPPERAIQGRVLGPEGDPVRGARIRAASEARDGDDRWRLDEVVRTDVAGAFRIGHLGAGPHRVHVLPASPFAPTSVAAEAGASGVEIRLSRVPHVAIRVVDARGEPVAGARVVVRKLGTRDSAGPGVLADLLNRWRARGAKRTGPDGVSRHSGLDLTTRHALGVLGPTSGPELAEFVDPSWSPANTTVRLAAGLRVTGVVRGTDRAPLARAHVVCTRPSGVITLERTEEDGSFRISGLGAGMVHLEVRTDAHESPETLGHASRWVAAGSEGVVLVLEPAGR